MSTWASTEFLLDLFAGAAADPLAAHTPNYGGPWSNNGAYVLRLDGLGGAYLPTVQGTANAGALTPVLPQADYTVQALIHRYALTPLNPFCGVVGRWTDDSNYFQLTWDGSTQDWLLADKNAGATAIIGTYHRTLAAGERTSGKLVMLGTSIGAVIDGVAQTPIVNVHHAGAGRAGIKTNADSNQTVADGLHLEQFLCYYP